MMPPAGGGRQLLNRPWINFQANTHVPFISVTSFIFASPSSKCNCSDRGPCSLVLRGTAFHPVRSMQDNSLSPRSTVRFG
jgi:hypothetical protein